MQIPADRVAGTTDLGIRAMDIQKIFKAALDSINDAFEPELKTEHIILYPYVSEDAKMQYWDFTKKNGFEYESGYDPCSAYGSAYLHGNNDIDGIMIRVDDWIPEDKIYHTLLHELAHIYITRNEIDGGHFQSKYCEKTGNTMRENTVYCGYSIWREIAAETVAMSLDPAPSYSIHKYLTELKAYSSQIKPNDQKGKIIIEDVILTILFSDEARLSDESLIRLLREEGFKFIETALLCIDKVKEPEFWIIDEEFAYILGFTFLKESALQ